MTQVKLGIIGFGVQGKTYSDFLKKEKIPSLTLAAICDNDRNVLKEAKELYPEVPQFSNYQDMLASGVVEAVVTTVPHYLHPEMAIAALAAGIHCMCEKPAGVYTKQVQEMLDFAESKPEVSLAIMFNQRMNPLYQKIKQIIADGEIGAIRRSNWLITNWWRSQSYYDQSPWRATWGGEGGGVLVNQAPHQLDLWQWICGVPTKVFSKCEYGFKRDIVVENEVTILTEYEDGSTGVFVTCTHDIFGTDRFEILGDQGKIVIENSKTAKVQRLLIPEEEMSNNMSLEEVGRLMQGTYENETFTEEIIEFDSVWGGQHIDTLENFGRHILYNEALIAPGADGMLGVRLANAVHLSSWLGKEVPLNFDDDLYLLELNKRIKEEGLYPERN